MSLTNIAPTNPAPDEADDEASHADALRAAFQGAFEALGGVEALAWWGLNDPARFYAAFARLLSGRRADAAMQFADVSDVPLGEPMTEEEWIRSVPKWAGADPYRE